MNRIIAITLLFIFSLSNLVSVYSFHSKGNGFVLVMVEEDENHLEVLEVKKYLPQENAPFEAFELIEFASEHLVEYQFIEYEDVHLSSVETPPDFMC